MVTMDDYKLELQAKKVELATLILFLGQGKRLMLELAQSLDDSALSGEPFPEELNNRVRHWCQANWTAPIADVLPPSKRYVDGQMMKWAGVSVWVDGVATTAPDNWPLIEANDTTPKGDDPPPAE